MRPTMTSTPRSASKRSGPRGGFAFLGVLLAGLVLLSAGRAQARWSPEAAQAVSEDYEMIRQAAWMAGIPDHAPVLAALCAHETYLQPLQGGTRDEMWGPCQVHWNTHSEFLRTSNIAEGALDLLDPYTGIRAGAEVLALMRNLYPHRSLDLVLCIYGCGTKALSFRRDCQYSQAVMRNLQEVQRALWTRRITDDTGYAAPARSVAQGSPPVWSAAGAALAKNAVVSPIWEEMNIQQVARR